MVAAAHIGVGKPDFVVPGWVVELVGEEILHFEGTIMLARRFCPHARNIDFIVVDVFYGYALQYCRNDRSKVEKAHRTWRKLTQRGVGE